jgi:endoglucanase
VPSENFPWGSNDFLLNHAIVLATAWSIKPEERYRDGALEILDHVLGRNVQDTCFVTGCGNRSPMRPHHRIMQGDTVDAPFPGFLVGGPNAARQDNVTNTPGGVTYASPFLARSWIDDWRSYASNETCINWNASLVWMLGWAQGLEAAKE